MRAIQVKRTGGPEVMELVDLPVPQPKSNEAVVKIEAVGVNFIDVYNCEGRYPVTLPFVPGQEAAGGGWGGGRAGPEVGGGERVACTPARGGCAADAAAGGARPVMEPAGGGGR